MSKEKIIWNVLMDGRTKQSLYRPGEAGGDSWVWGSQDFQKIGKWMWHDCETYALAPFTSQNIPLLFISVTGWVDPRAIVRPEGLSNWKIPKTPSGFKPSTYQPVAQCTVYMEEKRVLLTCNGKLMNWPNCVSGPVSCMVSVKSEGFPVQLRGYSFSVSTCYMESLMLLASYIWFIVTEISHFKVPLQLPFTWRKAYKNYFNTETDYKKINTQVSVTVTLKKCSLLTGHESGLFPWFRLCN